MSSLSVCMMVQNAEKTLAIALESLDNVYDELIIVDGGSTDSTCEIASTYNANIIHSKWSGNHSQQRNVYLSSVKADWVFVIDSDEFINQETLDFLRKIKSSNNEINTDNFWIPRKWISSFSKHHYITSAPHCPDVQRRLFKYNKDIYYTGQIIESIHNLNDRGQCLLDLSIYHLDLFINDEDKRRAKVRHYSQIDPRDGARHFYLPETKKIQTAEWNYDEISETTQVLLDKIVNNYLEKSQLNFLIPAEIKSDEFYNAIQKIAQEENIKTVLEIGSSSGEGSTEAFVTGLRDNPNKPTLFCMEISQTRCGKLATKYENDSFVKCYNISSVSLEKFPNENEVVSFYNNIQSYLNYYPLEQVLGWLRRDIEYVQGSGVSGDGIKKIKLEHQIEYFDVVLIDGCEFTGIAELEDIYGAKYILLDDINTFKNHQNFIRLSRDGNYKLIESNYSIRNGYAIFQKTSDATLIYEDVRSAVEAVEGFMVPGQEEFLFNKVKSLPDDAVIVEIGSFKGRSTVAIAYACVGTKRKLYSIDTWDGNNSDFAHRNFFEEWQGNVEKNGLEEYVVPLRGYSHDVLSRWQELVGNKPIDLIFIDGSHEYFDVLKNFELAFPLIKYGGWIAFHDVIHTWPGPEEVWHNIAKSRLINHEYSSTLACGQKLISGISSTSISQLPIHFFTIVLNGEPFIRYHIQVLKQLPFKWHWHIIEGVAELKHDTAWSLKLGGSISDEFHRNGRSYDGTTEYLDELEREYPENITIYRKPDGMFWQGKREMVNEPLYNINEECLLWQVDVDELWTVEQIFSARQMFIDNPEKTAAFYWCWYFVGEKLTISTRNCYTQNPEQEWLRTWRYNPGAVWVAHEPPRLQEPLLNGQWQDVAAVNPFLHHETEEYGLVFQLFAYVTPEQLKFKEQYYGYRNAVSQWEELQKQTQLPVLLRQYFPWVGDDTMVDTAQSCGVVPIAYRQADTIDWSFLQPEEIENEIKKLHELAPIILVDAVFFQLHQTGIARLWKTLLEEWVKNKFAKHIIVLDRVGTAPKIAGIRYRTIAAYDYDNTDADRRMLQQICDEEGADLFISTYYTTPNTTPSVFMVYDMIPEVMGWDINNLMWQVKHQAIKHASNYISISDNTALDLVRFFPEISKESVNVALCGVTSNFSPATETEVNNFRTKYGIYKPYFMIGRIGSYKNTILFLEAFVQLASKQGFDIVCTDIVGWFDEKLRAYTSGSTVHMLRLRDEELATAYSGAIALVYPSKYEGFGLPILEAMACGCPVITCPNASIPEVGGKAVLYVQDDDIDGMANALHEVQKPSVRKSLITAGLEQSQKFSWSKMAKVVSSVLIDTTLLNLNLKDINLIIFPDWSQPEELLCLDLERVIKALITHPESQNTTLLIDTSNISGEEVEMLLSSVTMNLLMEEDLDVTEGLEFSLVGQLGDIQWEALLPRIEARIVLEYENKQAVVQVKAESLPLYIVETSVDKLTDNTKLNNRLSSVLNQYKREQLKPSVLAQLRDLRKEMAELWLSTEQNLLEKVYLSDIGERHKILLNSSIQYEPLTETEQSFVAQIIAQVSQVFNELETVQYLLVAMLYCRPHQLPLVYELSHIPNWLLNDYLKFRLDSPLYFQELGEVDSYYQYMEQFINYLHSNILANSGSKLWQDVADFLATRANFIPLYFNSANLKDIYTKRADIIEFSLRQNNNQIDYEFPERSPEINRIRLGILASHFSPQTETFAALSVYEHLNRDLFEIILFTFNTSNHRLERYCAGHADAFVKLPVDLPSQVQAIRETELDFLFISTNVTAVTHQIALLALHRLAKIQMVDANSPVTTGMRHVDYYISSKLSEPEKNAQEHYTETLIKLDIPPQCFTFATEEQIQTTTSISRETFGIDETTVVYISGANYYKIIPELEVAWACIIKSVPNSVLLLYPFNPNWSSSYPSIAFQKRIVTTFAEYGLSEDRLIILDSVPNRADVKERLKLGDIYLDSYPYSGMTSLIDPLEMGLPTVIMEAESSRSKKGASLLRELQIPDLITNSEADYIQLAIILGIKPELRQQKSDRIKQKMQANPKFLDSRFFSAQMGTLFQELFDKYQAIALTEKLKLKDINLIIFPDWNQTEDILYQDLTSVISSLVHRSDKNQMTLLINIGNVSEDDTHLFLSDVVINLLLEEELDVTDGLEISLVGQLADIQWEALLPRIQARIVLEYENKQAVVQVKAESLPLYEQWQ